MSSLRAPTLAAAAGLVVVLSACSTQATPDATVTSASAQASVSTQPATALPDGVPVTAGAQLVEGFRPRGGAGAVGGGAGTVPSSGPSATATTARVNRGLEAAGGATKIVGSEKDGFVIAGNRKVGAATAWLNVNVTIPVPGSGPAVTYRYAIGPEPVASASP